MKRIRYAGFLLVVSTWLVGCANHPPAPVSDRGNVHSSSRSSGETPPGYYVVKKGDTLYSIALNNGQSHRDIAAWNNLENPNRIEVGQRLRVSRSAEPAAAADGGAVAVAIPVPSSASQPAATNSDTLKREPKGGKQVYSEQALAQARGEQAPAQNAAPTEKPAAAPVSPAPAVAESAAWLWPVTGKLAVSFVDGKNKGIDILAKNGQPIVATNAGKVTYSGNAIRGYGNMLIIRHDAQLSSVYAHNSKIFVVEGQVVKRGQKVAEVGSSDADQPKLHFEIRRQGVPVDPLKFLPEQK